MIDSVLNQIYLNWELILINSTPDCVELCSTLDQLKDERIKVVTLDSNKGISGTLTLALLKQRAIMSCFRSRRYTRSICSL